MPLSLFPYDSMRDVQRQFMTDILQAVRERRPLIAHAPTGLGKTVAALTPLLTVARKEGATIFFLTGRHTQQEIVLRTVRQIKEKHGLDLVATPLIGKKWLCAQEGSRAMTTGDFTSFCKALRENDQCEFFTKSREKNHLPTVLTAKLVKDLKIISPIPAEQIYNESCQQKLCPYEVALTLAAGADVVVCDYFYLFNPHLRESFLAKLGKKIEDSIIVIDEGHNLPDRARELLTERLSARSIKRAIKEAKEVNAEQSITYLVELQAVLTDLADGMSPGDERIIDEQTVTKEIESIAPIDIIAQTLEHSALDVQMKKNNSSMAAIAEFLAGWIEGEEGFCRTVRMDEFHAEPTISINKRCMDPALVTADVIKEARMTLLMSGTLVPTTMYKEILGFPPTTLEKIYPSPFKQENRLALIIPKTTTKYSERSPKQYEEIALHCATITNKVPGCSAVFFPSYAILSNVLPYFNRLCEKTVFTEEQGMTKEQKEDMLRRFSSYKASGAVLLGVASGSFGEGIDLPGILRCVIVVGLPLDRPDIETQELIKYFQAKYNKGMEYGYILPALTKTLQNAGRCIRTEQDHGALIFLDERYTWPMYRKSFPADWNIQIQPNYIPVLEHFFMHRS